VALRDCVDQADSVPQALERYTQLRRRHLHFYGQASRWLTPLFQSDLRLLPWLRDMFMNAGCALPVAGRLTRQVLVGVQQGWWPGQTLELSPAPVGEQPLPVAGEAPT
jgi:2-polyprenyl-6-methoxyphenol hydroxylase-like FAD-dependent oxidoreductase